MKKEDRDQILHDIGIMVDLGQAESVAFKFGSWDDKTELVITSCDSNITQYLSAKGYTYSIGSEGLKVS